MCLTDVVCVESLGGSTCYLMISSRSDGIAAESGLLFPFAMNLSDLSCSCVFHINYTSDAQGKVCAVMGSARWGWTPRRWKYPQLWGKECFIREYLCLYGFSLYEFIRIKRMMQNGHHIPQTALTSKNTLYTIIYRLWKLKIKANTGE